VTYLGVMSRSDGCLCCDGSCPNGTPTAVRDDQQRQVFQLNTGQGLIVVEGRAGLGQATPGISLQPGPPDNRPDLQIETTQAMGNGSAAVCDIGPTSAGGGGVFPIPMPDFTLDSPGPAPGTITGALADFACRFEYHPAGSLCTYFRDTASQSYLGLGSIVQFCDVITANAAFLPGESIVTVRLRDVNGSTGPTKQIVVRVSTPTPIPGS
jgi:hypothetical protein